MIAPLLALLLMSTGEVAPPSADQDILVLANKLQRWTGKFQIRGTRRKCLTVTSSGDTEVDHVGCEAFLACADQYQAETDASDERRIDKETRRARKATLIGHMKDCISDQRVVLLAQLKALRLRPSGE